MKRSILACLAGLLTWIVVVTVINRVLRLSLPNYTAAEHAPVHAGHEVGTPFDGYRDLAGGWCRNKLDIPIEPLGAVDHRQRGTCNVRAFAHRHLEQISDVVHLTFLLTIIPAVLVGALLPQRRNKDLNEVYSGPR
jgi:hypothetical protein